MRTLSLLLLVSLASGRGLSAQGHPIDWPVFGGDAQRTGWEKSDTRITRENVKNFELVWKRKFPNPHSGPRSLTPPVIVGMLISYRGFKELAFVADSSNSVYSVDADLNRVFWQKHFEPVKSSKPVTSACLQTVAAMPGLVPPTVFGGPRPAAGAVRRPTLPGNGFGQVRPLYAVSSDGKLHKLNTADGEDQSPAMDFLPANAKASPLTIHDGTIYATTTPGCGSSTIGIYSIDLTAAQPKVVSHIWDAAAASSLASPAFGTDGTVYVQTGTGEIISFSPNDLHLKQQSAASAGRAAAVATPVVFSHKDHDVIVSATPDGRLSLLDSATLAPLFQTPVLTSAKSVIQGGLASWLDQDGARWILAPVSGALNAELKASESNGPVTHGAVIAFKVEERDGKPALTPAWVSRDMATPEAPVITSGVIFALSAGEYSATGRPKPGTHATLYGLDALTGQEIYSTGKQVSAPGSLTGLSIANGRVFFATTDNTLYGFGVHLEI